jgi:succinate dehydrogenase/fumarate reductase flavoprotein subunit
VTGARAGRAAAQYASKAKGMPPDNAALTELKQGIYVPMNRVGGFAPHWVEQQLYNLMMPYYVLLVKHGDRLAATLTMVQFLKNHIVPKLVAKDVHELRLAHEAKNRILSVEMMLRSSIFRTESRGIHYREDYPRRNDPDWCADVKIRDKEGAMDVVKEPLPREWWPDLSKPYRERYFTRFPGED